MTQNLVRISKQCVIRFNEPSSVKAAELGLHLYKFNNSYLFLEKDENLQSRNRSYNPYDSNVLLRTTPEFIYGEQFHTSARLQTPNIDIPLINVSVNMVAGWFYNKNESLIATRFYYVVDGTKSVTVSAFVDDKLRTNLKANRQNIVLDRTMFNSSYDLRLIDLPAMLSSSDEQMQGIVENLFGQGQHTVSELFIEFAIVQKSQIVTFVKHDFPFNRFYITENSKSYRTNEESDNSLKLLLVEDSANDGYDFRLSHDKQSVESYLTSFLTDFDTWSISYEVSTIAFNNSGDTVGSMSISISNPHNQFEPVQFKPIILKSWLTPENLDDTLDHVVFDVRCVARTGISGMEIIRYAKIVEPNPLRWVFGDSFKIEKNELKFQKNQVVHKVEAVNDMPSIIQIIKPMFVFAQEGSTIKLLHYTNTISLKLGEGLTTDIKLRIGNRDYSPEKIIGDNAVFKVDGSEYFKDEKRWYVLDKDDHVISTGNLEKV